MEIPNFGISSHCMMISSVMFMTARLTIRAQTPVGITVGISPEFSHKMIVECSDSTQFQYCTVD
eukprot:COSAG02_NODE_3090_length_7388_cov_7.725614_4_plen_64_part_00